MMADMIYHLREDVVYVKPGDYVVQLSDEKKAKVFKVAGLYVISQLQPIESPLRGGQLLGFLDSKTVAASRPPDLFYRVDAFAQAFPTQEAAITAINTKALGEALQDQYISVNRFRKGQCTVHSA
jgi:hypothetical protein